MTISNAVKLAEDQYPTWLELFHNSILPADLNDKVSELLDTLEYIKDWEPSDQQIAQNNSCGIPWHDGCQ
jgi:hypothetical protein